MSAERIMLLGVNHKTAPVEIRERLAFSADPGAPFREIKVIPGCDEFCFLSTCNRVEVLFVASGGDDTERRIRDFLFAGSLSYQEAGKFVYLHKGEDAVRHLFRVGASLDSMIVGEPQILGQLKDAYRNADERDCTGPVLNRLLHKAFSVAKRVRTETNIGSSAVSISYAAVELAKKIFGSLSGKKVMLVGAGEMAELAAQHLMNQGVAEVVVANRTFERALKLARCFNGSAVAFDELLSELEVVDILISSTGAPGIILHHDDVKPVMRKRRHRPLFMIDIAVPRDLDPKLNDLDNIYLYGIDDLTNVVEVNKAERDKEATRAERIVVEESLKFLDWLASMEVSPTIVALRSRAEELGRLEVARTLAQLKNLSPKEQKQVEILASSLVNKLLHNPIQYLKANGTPEERRQRIDTVRRLYGLDGGD